MGYGREEFMGFYKRIPKIPEARIRGIVFWSKLVKISQNWSNDVEAEIGI